MRTYSTFAEIIAAWPSAGEFAADVGANPKLVAVWKCRNSIPGAYWDRVVASAAGRMIEGVTLGVLSELERIRESTRREVAAE